MVSSARITLAWVAVIIIAITTILLYTVLSPQVLIWQDVVAQILTDFSVTTYSNASTLTFMCFKVCPFIILGGSIIWAIITSLSEEFQSDFGEF